MKLLWLSHFVPYPPIGGAHQRTCNLVREMAGRHEVSLVCFNLLAETPEQLAAHRKKLEEYCASVEIWELPLRWRGPLWWAGMALSPLLPRPFSCYSFWSRAIERRWREKLQSERHDLLHVDTIDLAFFLEAATGLPTVLNHHNCESAMARRRAQLEPHPLKKLYLAAQAGKLATLERDACQRVAVNTTVSGSDGELLRANAPDIHVHVVENGTDDTFFTPADGLAEPDSVIFAGSLNWYPNQSAVRFFAKKIWPLIKARRPQAKFYLAGQKPPQWMQEWAAQDANIVLVPNPEDMRPYLGRAAVVVCSIVDGGGTRLKILDAMAMQKPVVSTTVGCEGLAVTPGENIEVADEPEAFSARVLDLLADREKRERLASAGRALVEARYSWRRIAEELDRAYDCALDRRRCPQCEVARTSKP